MSSKQGIARPGAQLLGQVAGHQGSTGAALGADHGDQLALGAIAQANLGHQAVQCGGQFVFSDRLGQHVAGTGLHGQAHGLLVAQQAAHQHRRTLVGRTLQQRRQLFAPQMTDPQQQQVRHAFQAVEGIDMPVAHQPRTDFQAGHALADALQVAQGRGVTAADQQSQPGFAGDGRDWGFSGIQHGVISPESE